MFLFVETSDNADVVSLVQETSMSPIIGQVFGIHLNKYETSNV